MHHRESHGKEITLLHHVDDYEPGGLEFAEIKTRILSYIDIGYSSNLFIHDTSVPPLDTMSLGFVVAQLALAPYPHRMIIYANCAPRREGKKPRLANADHGLMYARLKNGVEVLGVYSEHTFGFLKKEIDVFFELDVPNSGSQFRSRDFFPFAVSQIVRRDYSPLKKERDIQTIPDIPPHRVAWTDGFGNIKTSTRLSHIQQMNLKEGDRVEVSIDGIRLQGQVTFGGFQVEQGKLAVNIGSSGYGDPFVELFIRVRDRKDQTASEYFNNPVGGTKLEFKKIS